MCVYFALIKPNMRNGLIKVKLTKIMQEI
jgi:hypothetical protein